MLSITRVDVWYNVSIQCSYCDCPNYPSKYKHLIGIRFIIEQHMPMLKECLPVIDQAENMHCEVPKHDSMDCNLEEVEYNLLCKNIELLKEDLCAYHKFSVRGSTNVASMRECSEPMSYLRKQLML